MTSQEHQPGDKDGSERGPDVSVVVPTYREAENLRPLVTRLHHSLQKAGQSYELLIADEGSDDGTRAAAKELASEGYSVRLLLHTGSPDLSRSVLQGFRAAGGEVLVCMDADLSHPPRTVPRLVKCVRNGADFALGTRFAPGSHTEGLSVGRYVLSKLATLLARPFTGVSDPMSGFFALKRTTLQESAPLNPCGYKIALELLVKINPDSIAEIPISFGERRHGSSKLDWYESWRLLVHLWRLTWYSLFRAPGT